MLLLCGKRSRALTHFYDWDDLWTDGILSSKPNGFSERYFHGVTKYFETRLPRWADQVTTCSEYLREMATERGAARTTVIHNGLSATSAPEQGMARESLGMRSDALYLGFMGRTTDELSWCFDLLTEKIEHLPRLRLALCGCPKSVLQSLPQSVNSRIDHLGNLNPEQIPAFASAIDLGLLPLEENAFNMSRFPIKFGGIYDGRNSGALLGRGRMCSACSSYALGLSRRKEPGGVVSKWFERD